MATRSGDTPVVINTSAQWHKAINATIFVSRCRRSLPNGATSNHQRLGAFEKLDPEGAEIGQEVQYSKDSHNSEANQARPLDRTAQYRDDPDKTSKDEPNSEVDTLKMVRDELVKQLDAYGIVLVLLAGISFLAILQPPGSFDSGKLQESLLVSLFMLLSTLSFFIACTGIGAGMVGWAQLFSPFFDPKLAKYIAMYESECLKSKENNRSTKTPRLKWFREWLPECCKVGPHSAAVHDIQVLAKLCIENVYRMWRIRLYMAVALVLCIAAYICGALAVMGTNDLQRYMLIGAMAVGGVIVLHEICKTVSEAMKPVRKSIDGISPTKFLRGLSKFTP